MECQLVATVDGPFQAAWHVGGVANDVGGRLEVTWHVMGVVYDVFGR